MKADSRHSTSSHQSDSLPSVPGPLLRQIDAIVLITGIVIGAGIFRAPSLVAANSPDRLTFMLIWVAGGFISLIGALCYSEMSSTFPNAGGDYHFLKIAFGEKFSFLYVWARITVIQTGSIALLAYIAGDYLSQLYPLSAFSSAIYAAAIVSLLTLINISGIKFGTGLQKYLTFLQFTGIAIIIAAGFIIGPAIPVESMDVVVQSRPTNTSSFSMALIFVLLTFGGWNEAAFISSELKKGSKKMSKVLIVSILLITMIYLLVNMAFLHVLGLNSMAATEAVGVEMMRATSGDKGVVLIGVIISLSAVTSLNTTIFTGARSGYALGRDFPLFAFLGKWDSGKSTPVNALLLEGAIALILIFIGAFTRSGFEALVDFTAPVFWFFFLASAISLMVMRTKKPDLPRPFKVPIYPVTPLLFTGFCGYMLYASLTETGPGSLLGVALLIVGYVVSLLLSKEEKGSVD
jgi:amino acid transporter